MRKTDFTLHNGQPRLLKDRTHRDIGICAGVGYGKSEFGPKKAERARLDNPRSKTALTIAPSYRLLKKVCLPKYIEFLKICGFREGRRKGCDFWVNWADLTINFRTGQEMIFLSSSDVNSLVAYTAYFVHHDEAALQPEEIFRRSLQRLRCPKARYRQRCLTFTPEGMNHVYKMFDPETHPRTGIFSESPRRLLLHGSSHDNPYLDDEFLSDLETEFGWDEKYYQNYVLGWWVSLSRNAFYFAFDEAKNSGDVPIIAELEEMYLTFDFNVGKMAWAAIQREGDEYRVFKANRANGRNIDDACEQVIREFPPERFKNWRISVLGDATGHSRSTHSYTTGYQIIKDKLQQLYPRLTIDAHRNNPFVEERSRVTNRLFSELRLRIDRSCTKIIESAKSAETDIKRGIKKPADDDVTHPMEALDMALIKLEPPSIRYESRGVM